MFVKEDIFAHLSVEILDNSAEGILWFYLKSYQDEVSLYLAVCYLPLVTRRTPRKQVYISIAYYSMYQNKGQVVLTGNLNARCGVWDSFMW